jgi:hypothetical protein
MLHRDPTVRTTGGARNRGRIGAEVTRQKPDADFDEALVQRIVAAASERRLSTMGEFGQFVRPYLAAGQQREVSEAHRRYFARASQS